MGNTLSHLRQNFPFVRNLFSQQTLQTLISPDVHKITYEEFLVVIGELNSLSQKCVDSNGKQLVFAVKKGTDTTVFWKGTVQIACVKVNPNTQKVESYRLVTLSQFLTIFKTIKCQDSAAEQSKSSPKNMSVSTFFNNIDLQTQTDNLEKPSECCICLERKLEVILPCAHSYCLSCLEEWSESHDTCPICRERFEDSNDTWVLSEVPNAEEISKEIQESLMELTERCSSSSSCSSYETV